MPGATSGARGRGLGQRRTLAGASDARSPAGRACAAVDRVRERLLCGRRLLRRRVRWRLPQLCPDGKGRGLLAHQECRRRSRVRARRPATDRALPPAAGRGVYGAGGLRVRFLRRRRLLPNFRLRNLPVVRRSRLRRGVRASRQVRRRSGLGLYGAGRPATVSESAARRTARRAPRPRSVYRSPVPTASCCDQACTGTCYSCNQPQALGVCLPIDGAEDLVATTTCSGTGSARTRRRSSRLQGQERRSCALRMQAAPAGTAALFAFLRTRPIPTTSATPSCAASSDACACRFDGYPERNDSGSMSKRRR